MIEARRAQATFGDKLIADEVEGLYEDWMVHADQVMADDEIVMAAYEALSGLEVCKEIRRDPALNRLPILMVTARGEEADRVVGLEMGADDYVTKPFSPRELVARVKALLRRTAPGSEPDRTIEAGTLTIDPSAYRVSRSGKNVTLSTLEFRLLHHLASRPNRVFTRDQLLDAVWGTDRFVTPRSVDVYIRRLREKIEGDPEKPAYLKTVRGAGYMFEMETQAARAERGSRAN